MKSWRIGGETGRLSRTGNYAAAHRRSVDATGSGRSASWCICLPAPSSAPRHLRPLCAAREQRFRLPARRCRNVLFFLSILCGLLPAVLLRSNMAHRMPLTHPLGVAARLRLHASFA